MSLFAPGTIEKPVPSVELDLDPKLVSDDIHSCTRLGTVKPNFG